MPFDLGSIRRVFLCLCQMFGVDQFIVFAECLERDPGNLKQVTDSVAFSKLPKFIFSLFKKYLRKKKDRWGDFFQIEGNGESMTMALLDKKALTE